MTETQILLYLYMLISVICGIVVYKEGKEDNIARGKFLKLCLLCFVPCFNGMWLFIRCLQLFCEKYNVYDGLKKMSDAFKAYLSKPL